VLTVASAGIPGDYNSDGTVDAGDYVLWRKYQGTTHTLPNDPTGGTIGLAQYNTWRSHFGQPPGTGSALDDSAGRSAAVPEPATLLLGCLGMIALQGITARRQKGCQSITAHARAAAESLVAIFK
jgi:PEP-CTERM motif